MCRILTTALTLSFLLNANVLAANTNRTATAKSRKTALTHSLVCTLVPAAVGGVMMLHGQRISPIGFKQGSGKINDTETLAGLAIGSAGIVFGPGAGHAYAGKKGRFWSGAAIRSAAVAFTAVLASAGPDNSSWSAMDAKIAQVVVAFVMGGSICLGSAIYDIAAVGDSIDEYNEEHGVRSLSLEPTYIAGNGAPGIVLKLAI